MSTGLKSFHHFILGLLTRKPMSGYDIKRFLESLEWLVGSPSFGAIYPALHALLQDGMVTVKVLSNKNKPPRKIYTITEAGERALQEWIYQPFSLNASARGFTMRLILAEQLTCDGLVAHLEQRYAQVTNQRQALERMNAKLDQDTHKVQRLTFDYGMTITNPELAWLKDMLERLSAKSPLEDRSIRDLAASEV